MFATRFERFGPPEVLSAGELPEPHAGPGEVRIRVRTAGVSPVDLAIRAGKSRSPIALPHIPGVDAAGVVDEAGPGAEVGDEVFGAVDVARLGGATAEFAVLAFWAPKPPSMPWEQAGAAASGLETATRALDLLDVRAGTTLLVDGASGGVGSLVVGLALARGARVFGTAGDLEFVESLGATPIAYGPGLPARVPGRVDAALDVAGKGSLPELIELTGTPSSVVTLADFSGPSTAFAYPPARWAANRTGATASPRRRSSSRRAGSACRSRRASPTRPPRTPPRNAGRGGESSSCGSASRRPDHRRPRGRPAGFA